MIGLAQAFHWILIVMAIVWLTGIVLDFRYRVRRMRWLRLAIWTLVLSMAALYYLQPYQYQPKKKLKAAVTTSRNQTDSLKKEGYQLLKEPTELFQNTFSELVLLDTGLQEWQLNALQADQIITEFDEPLGLLDFQLERDILQGQRSSIQFVSNFDQAVNLYLTDQHRLIDSVHLEPGQYKSSLSFMPKAAGNFTYQVIALTELDTLAMEWVPFSVRNAAQPAILMLQSNPNFEARFIKNYLGDFEYAVSSRTRISKELFNEEFVNTSRKSLQRITSSLMEQFQLIILDKAAFNLLSTSEKRLLMQLNQVGNLGILVINTTPDEMNKLWTFTPSFNETIVEFGSTTLTNYLISNNSLAATIINNQPIGYAQQNGIGQIGLLTLQNLYQLDLQGNESLYEQSIQTVIEHLLPYEKSIDFIHMTNTPAMNQKTAIQFTSSSSNPQIFIDNLSHPVRESAFRPGLFETSFWPQKARWNSLKIEPDSLQHDFYVFSENDWSSKKKNDLLQMNELFAATYSKISDTIIIQEKHHWPKWIFLTLIVVGLGVLWAEQRFVNP